MKINAFFANRLNAPLYNHVWSWGSVDSHTNRVYLRAGQDDVYDDNGDWLLVFNPHWNESNGRKERLEHIELIKGGREAYAVLVRYKNHKIHSFNDESLVRLGQIVEEGDLIYAEMVDEMDVDDVTSGHRRDDLASDIVALMGGRKKETVRRAEIEVRLGQGEFRNAVLRLWDYRCCVTELTTTQAIRASHIKPWRDSTSDQRLDPLNGLPLIATLDALFDAGLISFLDNGSIVVSSSMKSADVENLSLTEMSLCRPLPSKTKRYLDHHRNSVFDG